MATEILPEAADAGTVKVSAVGEATVAAAVAALSATDTEAGGSKPVPVTDTTVPATPDGGENEVIVGAPGTVTTKSVGLVAVEPPTVTVTRPVVAPAGIERR